MLVLQSDIGSQELCWFSRVMLVLVSRSEGCGYEDGGAIGVVFGSGGEGGSESCGGGNGDGGVGSGDGGVNSGSEC